MDDYFNNLGSGVPEEQKPAQNEQTPVQSEPTAFNTEAPQQNNTFNAVQQPQRGTGYVAPPVQNYGNQNQYGSYYTPQNNGFGEPPVNNGKPKKKSKALGVIIAIVVVCAVVAGFGIWASDHIDTKVDNGTTSSSQSESKDEKSTSDSAEAKVESSDTNPVTDKEGNLTAVGVAKNNKESCVGITVYTDQSNYYYFYNYGGNNSQSGDKVASGEGSGVIMAESNGKTYIMTCAHVIEDGSSFTVTLDNDKEYEATMVGYDSQTDIGVLAIDATGLKVATFGDSGDIEVGEKCVAIGCPGGLQFKNSVTEGIVSALDVPVSSSIGYKNECIQVDAAINPGNSGGALFNMQGQVIGINSSKIASTEYEGMGFAVPSNTAVETANSLIKNGYVSGRAKIGIEYNSLAAYSSAQNILNALAEKGYKDAEGTMVIQTISDESDLKNKDIKQYDMIVAVDGETLTSTDVMTSKLSASKPGDTVTLTIARVQNNSIKTFEVKCKLIESKE